MTPTKPDPDTLGRAQIAATDALIDSGLGRKIRGDGNDMAAVVDVVVAAAEPLIAAHGRAEGQRQATALLASLEATAESLRHEIAAYGRDES